MTEQKTGGKPDDSGKGRDAYHYFVDGERYEWAAAGISGAQLKANLPGPTSGFKLFQEGRGGDADREVLDTDTIDLDPSRGGVAKFYTAPNATFGAASTAS